MTAQFTGQVVLITGAGGNLGQVVARRFAQGGARLVLVERDVQRLEQVAQALGGDVMTLGVDVTDDGAVDAMVRQVEARFGQIHILAHTVGGYAAGTPVHQTPQDVWDRMFLLNVRPIYVVCGRVVRHMLEQGVSGKIVMVLARASLQGAANSAAYTASKAAAERIMQSMAEEVKHQGIHVNGVLPSIIDTPPNRESMPNADYGKWVTADDIANTIAFLASDDARSLHGISLPVYGRV
jgi:NAD(P)-dependent dehydrogenase (short-subunit alcohol dehydrogenase family)